MKDTIFNGSGTVQMRDLSAREARKARKQRSGIAMGEAHLGIKEVSSMARDVVDYQGNKRNVGLIVYRATYHAAECSKRSDSIFSAAGILRPPTSPASSNHYPPTVAPGF